MSEALQETQETERPERAVLVREVAVTAEIGDGRTLEMRVVPFDEIGTAADPPDFKPYREQFMPGAFQNQERAAHRILLNFEHIQGLQGVVGHGVTLREGSDGYYGTFRVHDTQDGEKALTLLREKVIEHGSIEFIPLKSVRTAGGVIQRVKAHLDKLSLTRREPVYSKTAVLGLREQQEIVLEESLLPVPVDLEMVDRCRRLGIALPARLREQLDELERARVEAEERLEREKDEAEQAAEEASKPRRIEIERDESGRAVAYIEHK